MKNKINVLAWIAIIWAFAAIFIIGLELYFMLAGGVVIWAAPDLPVESWGQKQPIYNFLIIGAHAFSIFIIARGEYKNVRKNN